MARHVWSVLCAKSSIDKDENQVSLLSVAEKLILYVEPGTQDEVESQARAAKKKKQMQLVPANLHFVSWWVRSDYETAEQFTVRFRLDLPDGRMLPQRTVEVDLVEGTGGRIRWKLETIPFVGAGLYWISVQSKRETHWRTESKVPLEVAIEEFRSAPGLPTAPEQPS